MKNKKEKTLVQLSPETIKEIADEIDAGMICYYHLPAGELLTVPDENRMPGYDDEPWQEDLEKAEEIAPQSIVFSGMDSGESFRLMPDFIEEEVTDPKIKDTLLDALDRPKPFQRFKNRLHDIPDVLEQWYRYKEKRMREYVQEQVEVYNSRHGLGHPYARISSVAS